MEVLVRLFYILYYIKYRFKYKYVFVDDGQPRAEGEKPPGINFLYIFVITSCGQRFHPQS